MSLMLLLLCSSQPYQNLLQVASLMGQIGELLQQIGESDIDPRYQVSATVAPRDTWSLKSLAFAQDQQEGSRPKLGLVDGSDFAEGKDISVPKVTVI